MNKRHYEHTLPNIRGSLSNTYFQTLKREHKAGNPDYLTGLRIKNATPRQITDKRQIFKFILKQQP